jgi:hypothetical protein
MKAGRLLDVAGIAALAHLALLASCYVNPTVWKQEVRSPDGAWIATARTDQEGGFGSAWVETTVSIRKVNRTVNHGKPFDVFSYPGGGSIPKSYVVSNENADPNLQIVWLTPRHLQITHLSAVNFDLEVVRFADIDISYAENQRTVPAP